jgi:5'-nucleotidase
MIRRTSRRLAWAVVLGLVVFAAPSHALDILLTNDDGITSVGIQTLKDALVAAGHNVTVVAPLGERSGSSAALNLAPVQPVQLGPQEFALIALEELTIGGRAPVPATPATCVAFGTSVTLGGVPPDLVVSGTNIGANVGIATPFSGTVGATTLANTGGVPAIAFSSNAPDVPESDPAFAAHYANVAAFAVALIAHLESKPGALAHVPGLLPDGVALNVNYPTVAPEDVKGVKLTVQGQSADITLVFVPIGGGLYVPAVVPVDEPEPDVKDSDTVALAEGYITVTPIDTDFTTGPSQRNRLQSALVGLSP